MKAKVLLRNIGIVMLMLAVGLTAYGFISDSNSDKDKVVLNETQTPEGESKVAPSVEATENVSKETKAPETTEVVAKSTETPASEQPGTVSGTETPSGSEVPEVNVTATAAPTELPSDDSGAETTKTYMLVVTKGMSAMQIANRLEANGIIKNATEFTQVLISKGVTNDINVGNYEFTSNHTYDQIISALTGSQK